ncbi:lycopene beta-cyclase CrtY [Sphingomonas sp. BK235]|uniref:lycopene beta-cyclase CrtY n=1 Tax=Sphingomonas sp. BK235 TaxID=2512131 RepID=UPI00104DAE12|nr:lycopene beta-cyclase CrtY [Sphingomonas sp. BK235]TCP35721.1 lycopene beta-cyclase [Sphingomonas sp. BK235]
MPATLRCDLAIVGGGLAGALIALAVHLRHPLLDVRLIEAGERIGGNHLWSFFAGDIARADRHLIAPLVAHAWPGYDVRFPAHARQLAQAYYTVRSTGLDAHARATLPRRALMTSRRVLACSPTAVVFANGERLTATGVIDARGAGDLALLDCGWQKFVGHEVRTTAPHGVARPMVMDATVPQIDGYRFVYLLPFSGDRLLVEDTYYSDTPALDVPALAARVEAYAAASGWTIAETLHREQGVLPVVHGGDFEAYWRSGGSKLAKAGVRAGLFHPTTGYSLPDAVRLAQLVAAQHDFSGAALHDLTYSYAARLWAARRFYRMLDLMLFKAADPDQRYRVLERFYRLPAPLVARFYAAHSTALDKVRVLSGRPPVPLGRAIAALRGAA